MVVTSRDLQGDRPSGWPLVWKAWKYQRIPAACSTFQTCIL